MSALATEAVAGARVAVAYERISKFRVERDGLDVAVTRGVDRQAKDNDRSADFLGLTIAPGDHYTDNNRSASQFAKRERERWVALLDRVRSGGVSHVFVWLLDRACRTTEASEQLLAACRAGGALLVQSATHTIADPHNPDDIFRLKLSALLAEYEVAKMSVRQRRAKNEAAELGAPHGGRRRFGYEPGMTAIREREAAVIREAAARVLGGASLYSVAQWFNDGLSPDELGPTRYPTAEGKRWTGTNVGLMLKRPHLAGLRVHKGTTVGEGTWDPILTRADHELIVDKLGDPERRTSYTNARRYLLAGLATCAECGADLRGRPGTKANPERRAYACATGRHCYRAVELVDIAVTERIVHRLETITEAGKLRLERDDAADELAELARAKDAAKGRAKALAAKWATGELDDDTYDERRAAVAELVAETEARMVELRREASAPVAVLDGMTGSGARAAWEAADLGRRRAIIDTLAEVRLRGAATRRAPFKPSDVDVVWKLG